MNRLNTVDLHQQFLNILENKSLSMIFQPIVHLKDGKIFGYEGLTRGPLHSHFYSPLELFTYAERTGHLYTLEKIARKLAIKYNPIEKGEKLFININSQVIYDPLFTPGHTISLLEQYNLSPSDIVFEITERSAIQDFTAFREVLQHYRNQGFQIAIDDAGAGYSSLQAISELTPDYIKIDRSLVNGIDQNEVKMHILEAFVTFAKKMKSMIIAEGIETVEELHTVIELGIDCGQGFYLGYPSFPANKIDSEIVNDIKLKASNFNRRSIIVHLEDELIIMDCNQVVEKNTVSSLLSKVF